MGTIVFPWDLHTFAKSKETEKRIWANLTRLGYPVANYRSTPDKRVSRAAKLVMDAVDNLTIADRTPWVLVLTNSAWLEHSLSDVVPMSFAFSSCLSCMTVTTPKIIDLLRAKRPGDDFESDPAGDVLESVKRAGLLFWTGLRESAFGGVGQAARFHTLLSYRARYRLPTVWSSVYSGQFSPKVSDSVFSSAVQIIGESAVASIKSTVKVMHLKVRDIEPPDTKEVVL